jgi:Holliday junction resolvase-like predicted endonuclease
MKIIGQPYYGEPNASVRKQRLETVLLAWRFPRLLHAAERAVPPPSTALAVAELAIWFEILRTGQPVPPRYHLEGLQTYARLHGLGIDDLERAKTILIVGDQVAAHGNIPRLGYGGLHWSLLVGAQLEGKPTEAVLRKRFQNVEVHGDELIAWGAWGSCTDSIGPLARDALSATPDELARIWKIALALNIEYRFIPALPEGPTKALAELLRKELEAATPFLTVATDARLLRFAAAGEDSSPVPRELQLPESRLTGLLEVDSFFEHARHFYSEWYYDCVARAFARVADPFTLGDALLRLGPGSALNTALHEVVTERPELIAIYADHPAYGAEGAFMLLQLQQRTVFGHRSTPLDFNDEWTGVQQLTRELLLLGYQTIDWNSLVALGVHDESEALRRRHYGTAGIDRGKAQYDGSALWARAIADHERSAHFVKMLEEHFQGQAWRPDAVLVFALRLLGPLREANQAALATRLATAIVHGYGAALALDAGPLATPTALPAYGELLASLRASLDTDGKTWGRFLRPFDTADYLRRALDEQQRGGSSSTNGPGFVVPQVLRAHAEVLVALAGSLEAFAEPLQAALALFDADQKAGLHVRAFSWYPLARISRFGPAPAGEPLFVAIGRLFARVTADAPWIDTFLRNQSEPHVLAGVLAGLGPGHPFAATLRPRLGAQIETLLAGDGGIELGQALELANLMRQADIPHDAERLARHALQILGNLPRGASDTFTPVARMQLAGALAQQGLWQELLTFEPQGNLMVVSPQARFMENMRALALMETGSLAEAEEALHGVLKTEAANAVALANLTALHLRAQNWLGTIAAAEEAKRLLPPGDNLDHILLNEAHAREKLGDRFAAGQLLDTLSGPLRTRPDVVAAREELRGAESAHVPVPPAESTAAGAVDAPPLAALLGAVEAANGAHDKGRALEELMARFFGSVAGFTVNGRNIRTETEEIDIVIRNGATDPVFSREEVIVLVECKNWSGKCGRNEFVLFKEKIANRNLRCSVGFLVSWNGFAETVTKEMLRTSQQRMLVVPLTGERVRQAIASGNLAEELHAAFDEALQT